MMRDLFKKLRCGRGDADAGKNASSTCEEKVNDTEENVTNEENGSNGEKEQLLNGNSENEEKQEENGEQNEREEKETEKEEKNEEDATQVEKVNEEEQSEEKDGNTIENEKEEDKLLQEEGESSTEVDKKSKKKEASRWMCGLGRKSTEKKQKNEKKCKTPTKKAGLNEEDKSANEEKDNAKESSKENGNDEVQENEEKAEDNKKNENEPEKEIIVSPSDTQNGEEVVVFVAEGEAVVDEKEADTNCSNNEECCVKGEGLFSAAKGSNAYFEVHILSEDLSNFKCQIHDQNGNEVTTDIEAIGDNVHKVTYCPNSAGLHAIEATWKGDHVIGSPFQVQVNDLE